MMLKKSNGSCRIDQEQDYIFAVYHIFAESTCQFFVATFLLR